MISFNWCFYLWKCLAIFMSSGKVILFFKLIFVFCVKVNNCIDFLGAYLLKKYYETVWISLLDHFWIFIFYCAIIVLFCIIELIFSHIYFMFFWDTFINVFIKLLLLNRLFFCWSYFTIVKRFWATCFFL